jgi:NADH-quinone oxidoreductase subunit A
MSSLFFIAQQVQPGIGDPRVSWAPIVVLILIAVGFAVGNIILSTRVGPTRTGAAKETTYESGMIPVGDARQRFNIRFYQVAITFLVFDVEIVFLYPFATIFPHVVQAEHAFGGVLLIGVVIFMSLIMLGYFYEWGKGVFRWD